MGSTDQIPTFLQRLATHPWRALYPWGVFLWLRFSRHQVVCTLRQTNTPFFTRRFRKTKCSELNYCSPRACTSTIRTTKVVRLSTSRREWVRTESSALYWNLAARIIFTTRMVDWPRTSRESPGILEA